MRVYVHMKSGKRLASHGLVDAAAEDFYHNLIQEVGSGAPTISFESVDGSIEIITANIEFFYMSENFLLDPGGL